MPHESTGVSGRTRLGVLAATALVAAAGTAWIVSTGAPAAAAPSPEFKYLDEDDDDAAAKLLDPLVKKYGSPARCAELVKLLRTKRSYPGKLKDSDTLEWDCPDGKKRRFTYILPSKYSASKPVGVLFFLHGAVSQPAPGGGAGEAAQIAMPAVKELGIAVVGPSTYDRVEWGDPSCRALFRHAYRWLLRNVNIDENRVWIAGDSDGGRGAYRIVETEAGALAAAVPVIGSPGGVSRFLNFRNLSWFAINGEKDSIFDVAHVRESVEGMKASGIDVTWKLVPGGSHDPFYFVKFKDEVQSFLKAHPRDPFPKKVEWQLDPESKDHGGGYPTNTFRWIRIDEAGSAASAHAFEDDGKALIRGDFPRIEARRDGNRIEVFTRGVTKCSVLVAPEMCDAKQDLEVRTNGKLSFRGKVEPDARVILEEARLSLDRTSVFVARIAIDVDAPEFVPPEPPVEPAPTPGTK